MSDILAILFGQAEVPSVAQAKSWLEKLGAFNDYLAGAPLGVLLFLFGAGVGLAFRAWHLFPNKLIGPTITFGCTVLFCLGAPRGEMDLRLWIVRNILIGSIIGVAAYFLHRIVAKRIPSLAENGDTAVTPKPD